MIFEKKKKMAPLVAKKSMPLSGQAERNALRLKNKAQGGLDRINEVMRPGNKKNIVKGQIRLAKQKKIGAMKDTWKNSPSTGKGVGY